MAKLTPAEAEVVRLVSLGCTVRETAVIMDRCFSTTDNQKTSAMKKLGVHNLATLTRRALVLEVTTLDDKLSRREKRELNKLRRNGSP